MELLAAVIVDPSLDQIVFQIVERKFHGLIADQRWVGVHAITWNKKPRNAGKARTGKGGGTLCARGSCGFAALLAGAEVDRQLSYVVRTRRSGLAVLHALYRPERNGRFFRYLAALGMRELVQLPENVGKFCSKHGNGLSGLVWPASRPEKARANKSTV